MKRFTSQKHRIERRMLDDLNSLLSGIRYVPPVAHGGRGMCSQSEITDVSDVVADSSII